MKWKQKSVLELSIGLSVKKKIGYKSIKGYPQGLKIKWRKILELEKIRIKPKPPK